MFSNPPEKVLYCQPLYDQMERELSCVQFHHGLPSQEQLKHLSSESHCNLVVLDDLMDRVTSSTRWKTYLSKACITEI